jgi:predicted RNA polymerase sigma factor
VPEAVEDEMDETTIPDERLELIFTCCHPALATEAQVALTLSALGGLDTPEIADAFIVSRRRRSGRPGSRSAYRLLTCFPSAWPPSSPSST